ncbi:hypothetical protein AAHA92_07042 [Salvia divinorum]|uniref:Uncharacterized protein n=1 Tax=Salvia divinorum TaxID=28513 RepID=A0ABD1I8P3_SALDI
MLQHEVSSFDFAGKDEETYFEEMKAPNLEDQTLIQHQTRNDQFLTRRRHIFLGITTSIATSNSLHRCLFCSRRCVVRIARFSSLYFKRILHLVVQSDGYQVRPPFGKRAPSFVRYRECKTW